MKNKNIFAGVDRGIDDSDEKSESSEPDKIEVSSDDELRQRKPEPENLNE
jgi:hypothetical protein